MPPRLNEVAVADPSGRTDAPLTRSWAARACSFGGRAFPHAALRMSARRVVPSPERFRGGCSFGADPGRKRAPNRTLPRASARMYFAYSKRSPRTIGSRVWLAIHSPSRSRCRVQGTIAWPKGRAGEHHATNAAHARLRVHVVHCLDRYCLGRGWHSLRELLPKQAGSRPRPRGPTMPRLDQVLQG